MNETRGHARIPWVAAVLSLFCTGLGHIYCGRIVTGLALFLASLLFAPVAVLVSWLAPYTIVLVGLIAAALGVIGIYLFAVVDSFRLARRMKTGYQPKEYNRPAIYAAFFLVGVSYPLGVAHYLRSHALEAFYIPTASMAPNIMAGDRVLANKALYRFTAPQRGDVIIFRNPTDRRHNFVKRVIGLPGDRVEVRDKAVYVNGRKLQRDRVPPSSLAWAGQNVAGDVFYERNAAARYRIVLGDGDGDIPDYPETKVPEGACFVLGDNRDRSRDSRQFGFVPLGDVLGSVQYVYYPATTWQRFGDLRD